MRVADPIKFFNNIGAQKIGGDNEGFITISDDAEGTRDDGIISNLKSGVRDKVGEALSILGFENPVPYTAIRAYSSKVSEYINRLLSNEWAGLRGFEVCSFTINGSFIPTEEDKQKIQDMQTSFTMGANLNAANYDVQKTMARGFEQAGANGGVSGIMGMGMSMGQMGGLGQMQNVQPYAQQPYMNNPTPVQVAVTQNNSDTWTCACGKENTGNFCSNCGGKKPIVNSSAVWTCSCGTENSGNFCSNCGNRKATKLVCDKCGWTSEGASDMKFCPNCGDPVTVADFK
jgi:membrane protease subunit (stomatin/prohibitin family)